MNTMTIHLSEELFVLLEAEARRLGKPAPQVVQEHLFEWLHLPVHTTPRTAKQRSEEVLRAAGLLTELSAEEQYRATHCTTTLTDVRTALDRSSGQPLSSIVLEMRGSKA